MDMKPRYNAERGSVIFQGPVEGEQRGSAHNQVCLSHPLVCSVHSAIPSLTKRGEGQGQSWGEDALCSLVPAPNGHSLLFPEASVSSRCLALS